MADIQYLRQNDVDSSRLSARYRHVRGQVLLHHLDGPPREYRLKKWHKHVGDRVQTYDIIASIETDQFVVDIELFEEGVLAECLFSVGSLVPDGSIIARIKSDEPKA
jgi:hypothetical protein